MRTACIALFGLFAASLAANADVTLTLDPINGTVSGSPGDTVGWGYTLDNGTDDYLLVAYSSFCEAGQDPLFTTCSPNLGASTYTDFMVDNFILIAPDGSATAGYDPTIMSGVGEYGIDSSISSGTDAGSITVVYDLFDGDPTAGANQICANPSANVCDFEISAAAEVDVLGGTTATPEPRTAGLFIVGLLLVIIGFLGARRKSSKLE